MYRHTPVDLRGPFTRHRPWWQFAPPEPKSAGGTRCVMPPAAEDVRMDLVARVRRQIAEGTYDTPEKWEAALQRLLARLGLA